jgi:hypothetical protein
MENKAPPPAGFPPRICLTSASIKRIGKGIPGRAYPIEGNYFLKSSDTVFVSLKEHEAILADVQWPGALAAPRCEEADARDFAQSAEIIRLAGEIDRLKAVQDLGIEHYAGAAREGLEEINRMAARVAELEKALLEIENYGTTTWEGETAYSLTAMLAREALDSEK